MPIKAKEQEDMLGIRLGVIEQKIWTEAEVYTKLSKVVNICVDQTSDNVNGQYSPLVNSC